MSKAPEFLTETPQGPPTMNTISDILSGMLLTGGVFLQADLTAPWSIRAEVSPADCQPFIQAPRQIIAYHLVTAGACLVRLDTGESISLERGDLVILPRNPPHVLTTDPGMEPTPGGELIQAGMDGGLASIVHGGGGERTQLLCGFLGSATDITCLAAVLPEVLKLPGRDWPAAAWIESTFRFAVHESASGHADSREALGKLAEVLFAVAVRHYFALHPASFKVALAGMHDGHVGRALMLLHERLHDAWTTASLAQAVGLSRSAFADRFTRAVGEPPMRYLAHRRLEKASLQLLDGSAAVTHIAYAAGYESESAFSRAFRRVYGAPPAKWRRSMMQAAPAPVPAAQPARASPNSAAQPDPDRRTVRGA